MRSVIENGTVVNEGKARRGYVVFEGDTITEIGEGDYNGGEDVTHIDATGKIVMPGVIDTHVHFREPGLTDAADFATESAAAAIGGTTSVFDMPNTIPPTTSLDSLERKAELVGSKSVVNYSLFLGATADNLDQIRHLNPREVCGVKLFLGSSTGGMLLNDEYSLSALFAESPVIISAHCEQESIIRANIEHLKAQYPDATAEIHPLVRTAEACYRASAHAVELADKYQSRLNVAHVTTASELSLFESCPVADKRITAEAVTAHLWFSDHDYAKSGNLIKCNPSVKTAEDRTALRAEVGRKIDTLATDHAPHTAAAKARPYWDAPSGMPVIQYSLCCALEYLSPERAVTVMCHNPATIYNIERRGFLRVGYKADIVIVESGSWSVCREGIASKCGWSPLVGTTFSHRVWRTIINGRTVWDGTQIDSSRNGERILLSR